MPNTGIEPATLRSLARHSNQLSYAAAQMTPYVMKKVAISNEHQPNLQS